MIMKDGVIKPLFSTKIHWGNYSASHRGEAAYIILWLEVRALGFWTGPTEFRRLLSFLQTAVSPAVKWEQPWPWRAVNSVKISHIKLWVQCLACKRGSINVSLFVLLLSCNHFCKAYSLSSFHIILKTLFYPIF